MKPSVLLCALTLFYGLCFRVEATLPPVVIDETNFPLDEVGTYRVGYQLRGEKEVDLPVGWTGGLDSPNGAECQAAGMQNGQAAWLLHCPWKGKTGVTFQEFNVELPRDGVIALHGATALRTEAVGKSDGVVCRVLVDGQKRYEALRQDADWRPFDVDLSAEAGMAVTIRFETDPGLRDNSAFDFSLWANRRIEAPGVAPNANHPGRFPATDLRRLVSRENGSVVPPSGFPGQTSVSSEGTGAILRYEGPDGVFAYHWTPGKAEELFGCVELRSTLPGKPPSTVPLAAQAHVDWIGPAALQGAELNVVPSKGQEPGRVVWKRRYAVHQQTATLTSTLRIQAKSLVCDCECDLPAIRALEGGRWGPVARRRFVQVPYYSQPSEFLMQEDLFTGAFLDWTISRASSQSGTRAAYDPRTDGTRNPLRERVIFTAATSLDETLPNIPNAESPYRADLARQVMLDIWGGSFDGVRERLHALAAAGTYGPATAILHDWQWGGYDNKLPRHVPANPKLGGDEALKKLVQSSAADEIRVALHENYVDDYPDSPDFAAADIALAPDGSWTKAWFNESTKIQSFGVKPGRILPLAKMQGPEVVRRYDTAACYLDVHSAVPPWFHVDAEATQPGAGEFLPVWEAHRELWAYERALHRGPVLGEGNNHWYWSGSLDGVEAQFGQGWPDGQGTAAPLLVDFDLLKIHPLQLNHGMGYYDRWWGKDGPAAGHPLLALLDRYRMQEAAYGHQGFLSGEVWKDPGAAWLESHLLPPLTSRSALASPTAIEYAVGDQWLNVSDVVRAGGDFSRVRVRYDNGLTVWANGGPGPLRVGAETIPPDGWLARGGEGAAAFTAGTTLRQGGVSDFAETADQVFANARAAADWQPPGVTRVRPEVVDFAPTGPHGFRASYRWDVYEALKSDFRCFVHFVPVKDDPAKETIRFQQDHRLATPTSQWKPGQTVADGPWEVTLPADLAPGDYWWTVGLYGSVEGRRTLQGHSDPHRRLVLGILHVSVDGPPSFSAERPTREDTAPLNADSRVLDFGEIRTDGSVFVQREGPGWVLRPFPVDRNFTVELAAARFGAPAGTAVENGWWRLPLTGQNTYRWTAPK